MRRASRTSAGPVGIVSTITDVGEQAESASAAVGEHRLSGGAVGGESGGDEPAAPSPALDGGKIFFLVVNALCMLTIRKKIPENLRVTSIWPASRC